MMMLPDDPIVSCMLRTGYPPWMQDEYYDEDEEDYEEEEEEERMVSFDIYFCDLKPEAQKELLEAVGVDDPAEMNWDGYLLPIATVHFEDEED